MCLWNLGTLDVPSTIDVLWDVCSAESRGPRTHCLQIMHLKGTLEEVTCRVGQGCRGSTSCPPLPLPARSSPLPHILTRVDCRSVYHVTCECASSGSISLSLADVIPSRGRDVHECTLRAAADKLLTLLCLRSIFLLKTPTHASNRRQAMHHYLVCLCLFSLELEVCGCAIMCVYASVTVWCLLMNLPNAQMTSCRLAPRTIKFLEKACGPGGGTPAAPGANPGVGVSVVNRKQFTYLCDRDKSLHVRK